MCIRDRRIVGGVVVGAEGVAFMPHNAVCGVALRVLGNKATVSYTHLRAHETVLDIVCRLLLEKKKAKKKKKQKHLYIDDRMQTNESMKREQ